MYLPFPIESHANRLIATIESKGGWGKNNFKKKKNAGRSLISTVDTHTRTHTHTTQLEVVRGQQRQLERRVDETRAGLQDARRRLELQADQLSQARLQLDHGHRHRAASQAEKLIQVRHQRLSLSLSLSLSL